MKFKIQISTAEKNKIIPYEYQTSTTQEKNILPHSHTATENDILGFINAINHKLYYLDSKSNSINYLTSMELACIKWGLKGKTAEVLFITLKHPPIIT